MTVVGKVLVAQKLCEDIERALSGFRVSFDIVPQPQERRQADDDVLLPVDRLLEQFKVFRRAETLVKGLFYVLLQRLRIFISPLKDAHGF